MLTHSEMLDDQHLCMEEWGRAMAELAPDDPLNAFHEIFHRHVAVIKRFGRFPHRNKILQRPNTAAEEDFLANSSFRFDLPLIRRPDGAFAFAGTVKKRTVKLLDHEYQTLLPDVDEAPQGAFEFKYLGPDKVFTRAQEQLKKQGYIRIGDSVPDFTAETSLGRSTSMTSSATPGACCSRIRRTSRPCAPPNSGRPPSSSPSGAARREGHRPERRQHRGSCSAGSPTSTRPSTRR